MTEFVTLGHKCLTFYGTIDEAKDLAIELRNAFNVAGIDMSTKLNDFVFLLEAEYQSWYNLHPDDWGKIKE